IFESIVMKSLPCTAKNGAKKLQALENTLNTCTIGKHRYRVSVKSLGNLVERILFKGVWNGMTKSHKFDHVAESGSEMLSYGSKKFKNADFLKENLNGPHFWNALKLGTTSTFFWERVCDFS